MAEENQKPVNLGDLGTATSSDIRKALEGQPSPVEADDSVDPTPPTETSDPTPAVAGTDVDEILGGNAFNLSEKEDGTYEFFNPYDSNLDVDLDQFETQRRRVSEDSMLSGILNGVEGLEEGFTYGGIQDTVKRSEEAQGVVNKMKNGLTQLVADTGINVAQGFGSLLYGVPSAIVNGDITKLYDNSLANNLDKGTEFLDEFYKIKRGGDQSTGQKAANFLFDDLAGGASFVMGAIATEMAFTALSAATFGTAAPAQAAATAGLVARGTRLVHKAMQGGKALMSGSLVDDALRASRALGAKATREGASAALQTAAQAARTPMAMQAAARVSRQLITGASMESGMEARHMLNAAVENQKHQYEELNGKGSFTEEMSGQFREEISGYADGVFGTNMALVGASNMLMFPKLFGVGLRKGMSTAKFIDTSKLSQRARARLAKNMGVVEGKLPRMVDAARGNTMGRIVGRGGQIGRVTAANTKNALYEGFIEEGGQGAISRSTEDYISKRYDPKGVEGTVRFADSFLEGLKGSYTTKDGFKEIGIGMLLAFTGVPMYARNQSTTASSESETAGKPEKKWKWQMMGGYADQRNALIAQDKNMDAIIALNEKHGDVGGILKAEIANMNRQNVLQSEQDVSIQEGRFKEAKDAEAEMIFSHAATKVVTGRYEQSIEEAQQVMDEMSDEELREQLGPDAKNMTGEDLRTHRNKAMESYRARMDRARQAYERAGEVYRGADPDIHTGVAHMLYMVQEKDAREKKIAEEMAGAIEGMNEGQILDFMQATRDLNNRDEVLGELLTLINRRKDIDKQLATKKARGIIKNIDPKKQEARDAEVAILQESQQENLDAMQRLMDVMSTANNADRNKYDFSSVDFLEGLANLHQEIQLQKTQGQGIQKADIEQLYADLQAVSADRMELINNYNDFISPGGVQRFEARMIGSIERLADMSPEERKESRQEEAAKEDAEATTPDSADTPQAPAEETPASQSSDPAVPGTPPTDDGSGSFEAPPGSDVGPDTAGFGFPDPTPGNVGVPKGVPGSMGLGEQGTVAAPTEVPTTEPAQQPARSGVGEVSFQFTNANNSTEANGKSVLNERYLAGLKKVISGLPVGTVLVASQNPDGKISITADGVLLAEVKTLPTAIMNLLKTESSVQLVTTSEVERKFVGGETVNEIIDGELVSSTRKQGQPAVESRVNKVLPNGAQDIKGMNIMPNTHHALLDVAGVDPMGNAQRVTPDARFAGNLLVSTVDSASKQEAWHSVQLDAMGAKRANQIVDLIDAFNQFAVSRDAMTPEQVQLLKGFANASDINLDKPTSEVAKRMRGELRAILGVGYESAQRDKLKKSISNPSARRPLLAVEPLGKKQEGIKLVSLHMGEKNLSHDKAGNRLSAGSKLVAIHLASHRLNASKEGSVLVADGDGNFEAVQMRDMVDRFGSFSYRMPFVVDGKIYNTQFSSVEVSLEPMVPVPTDPRTDRTEVETPTTDPALFIDLDTLPTDLSNFTLDTDDYLPSSSQDSDSTDPMERAGTLYEVPGLTSRQLKDGLNFSTGVMARAFSTHLRTKNRYKPVSPDYLRRTVKGYLEAQLAHYKSLKQEGPVVQIVEAHEAYLSDKNFNPLMDLAMVSLLNQSEGTVRLRGKGSLEEALKNIGNSDPSAAELDEANQAERESNPMAAFDENFAFGVDPNSTLRLESKLLLMGLVDKYGVSANSVGLAGQKFLNSKDLQSKLSPVLAGVDPSYDKVKERLEEHVATFPQFQSVLDTLSDQYALNSLPPGLKANSTAKEYAKIQKRALSVQDMIRNQVVVFASKESTTFDSASIVKAKAQNDPYGTPAEVKIWNSNSRNMREHVATDMRSTLIERGFFDLEGKPVKSQFKAAHEELLKISELPKPDQAKALAAVLKKEFGIVVPLVALTSSNLTKTEKGAPVFKGIEKILNNPKSQGGVFGRFRNALGVLSKKDVALEDMISDTDGYGKDLINFFVGLADYRENFIQNSSKDGDNKVRYQFSAPKLIHQILRDIKTAGIEEPSSILLGKRFAQLSQENQRLIGLTYFSGIKQGKGKERNFHAMQVGDNIMAQLAFYGNRNTYTQKNSRGEVVMVSKFLMPTLADKQTMPILQAPAMSAKQAGIVLNESVKDKAWESLKFKDVVPNVKGAYQGSLKDSIDLEVDRIMGIQSGNTEGMTAAQRVAVGFVMMPGLNGLAEAFVEGKIKRADFRDRVHSKAVGMFEEAMDADIQYMLRETKGTIWEETTKKDGPRTIGKLNQFNASKGRRNTPSDFVRMHVAPGLDSVNKGGMHKVAFVAYLAKYSMDSLNVRTGIIIDTMGDPGAFVKTDNETGKIKQAKTATNLGKRFASLIAPGTSIPFVSFNDRNGNLVSNEAVNFLVIPSRVVSKASHYAYLKKIGQSADELSMQENYDSADAAEYTTVEEHLGILYAQGKISSFELEGILGKIAKGKKLDNAQLAWFQPMKPVTTARVGDHMLYVKSASFPLVPQLTQGTELDKLRVFMEGNNVQRAAYDSAVKLGNEWADPNDKQATADEKMVPVHKGASVVIDEKALRMRVIRNVNRKYMRIQQEVPTSKTNEKVHGSQVAKLLLVDLIDAKFELNGESLTGRDMHGKYLQARSDEQNARLELFAKRYGMNIDKENNLYHTPESKQKFAERIQEEGTSRGYDPNEMAHLYFDDKLNAFTTPLEAGPSSERIENLIKSIVFSEVYEPSIEGFSGPIRPEVGLKTLDDKLVNKSDIMWLKKGGKKIFKGKKLKVAKKGQLDQIIMPWKYKANLEVKDSEGKPLYLDEDGNIDMDKLPVELQRVFAYRIPGQRKSSSAAFEIVGFLPAEYGDTLIVNEELVGRIGQDYDIDKMFGFLYSIEQAEDGTISVVRDKGTTKPVKNTFKKSLFRGQAMKPEIDSKGNLVLRPTREQIAGKNVGLSTTTQEGVAIGYGKRVSNTPYIIELDAEYVAKTFDLQDEAVEGEQRIVQSGKVVIPAGKYNTKIVGAESLQSEDVDSLIRKYIRGLGVSNSIDEILPDASALQGIDYDSTELLLELILEKLGTDYNGLLSYIGKENDRVGNETGGEVLAFEDNPGSELVREAEEYFRQNPQNEQTLVNDPARSIAEARNRQVDIYIASMTSQDKAVQRAIHAPVTDGYAISLADQMDQLLHDDAVLGLPMSQSYNSRKANAARSAKKSIGVFAVHNVLHSQLQQSLAASRNGGIEYMEEGFVTILSKPGAERPTENINFGDMGIHDTSFILDYKNTPVAGNRSDQFSRLLNHAVDNENNGLLDKLGITEDTWALWTGLTHMGYNQETIGLLVAMPAVQEYLTAKSRSRRLGDSGQLEVGIFTEKYARQLEDIATGKVDLDSIPALDKESMLGMVQGTSELSEKEQVMMNFQALLAVDKLVDLSKDVAKVQNHMSLDTKRPKTMVALQVAIAKMEKPNKTQFNGNVLPLDEAIGATGATVSGQVSAVVANTAMTLMNLQQNMLPMSDVGQLVKDFQKAELYDSVENSITTLVKGAKSTAYALFTEKVSGKTSEEIRSEAHDINTGGIATRLIKARKNKAVGNNPFIKQLVAVNAPNTYPHIEFPGDRQLESDPIELQRAFLDLLRSSDPEVKSFAEYLVSYALATSGGRLKSRGYLKYVPAEYLQSKGLGDMVNTGSISDILNDPSKTTEIVRHNSELAPRFNNFSEAGITLIQGIPHQRVISPSFKGHVRVGNKLYAPTGFAMDRNSKGETLRPLQVVTELGDYLTDEYSTRPQPLDKLPTAKRPKGPSLAEAPSMPVHYYDSITDAVPPEMGSFPEGVTGPPAGMGLEGPKKKVNDEVVRSDNPNKMPMGIKEFLAISDLRDNPFLQELARTQEALSPEDRVTVVISDDLPGKGKYNAGTNTVTLRRDMINDSRAVTHEMIHAFTSLSIKVVQGQAKISDPKKKAEMEAAVNELKKLFKIVRSPESIAKMGLSFAGQQQAMRGYRAFRAQKDGKTLSAEEQLDVDFFKENLDDYYAFVSLEEFVAESFSNKAFAERMSKLSLNRNETFIDRFIAAVNKALMALGVNFGKDTEFLREVYTVSMGLVDIQTGGQIGLIPGQDIPSSDLIDGVSAVDIAGQNLRGVDQMQAYKEKRIRQFEELKSRYNGNREFVRRVEARLVQERKDLQALTDDSVQVGPDYFLSVGQRELDFARRTIENVDSTDPQIDMALSALENIYSVVEFYDKSRDILRDPALVDVATALRKEASELKDNYLDKARDILRRDAMQELGRLGVNVNADSFQTLEQTGWLKSRLMDASRQGTTELSFLDKIVRDASQKQRVAFNSRAKRYMDSSKLFKETAYFKKHGWNGMVELDAKGNPTANMLTMLSGSYESEYDLKRAELGNTKAFYDWKKSVTGRIDIDAMFDLTGTQVKRKNNPKYLEYLTKTYGKAGAAEFLQQQETMLQEYLDMRTSEFDTLDITLGENAADAKALWDAKNSPIQAYKRAEGKGGRRIKGATGRFLLDIPLRTLKGKATGYYDARFAELQADSEALAFYNDYRQQMKEMMAMLPAHKMTREAHLVRNGLFIPAIAKSLTNDLFKAGGLANMMEQLPDNIRGAFTIDPSYNVNKLIDPVTGRPRQELPTYFLGQVDPETQEYDMDRTFLAFAMMATTYDSKNAIEDKVRMTKSVMGNARMRASKKGLTETLLNKLGAETPPGYADEASRETTMKTVDTVVDTFYGYQGSDVTFAAGRDLWTKEQTEKIDALEENKLAAKTEEERERIQNEIDEATPQVSVGKGVRGMQQFIQAKGMAWNIPAAVVNMVFGAISVFKHASGQRDFTEADTRKATGIMLNSTWNNMSLNTGLTQNAAALKIQNMMINFDVLKDFTEMRYDVRKFVNQASEAGVNQAARQGFNKLRMYEIQRSSEYFVYGQGTISVLLNEKVDGKSLWEHMNADGVIDIDGYRPGEEKHLALMNKIDQINKRIHGNYDPASPIAIKKTLLGPLLMQFRSWLPEAVASRFEKEKYDPYLQRTVKGTYQTMFFSNAMRKHLGAMLPMLMPSWARTKGMNEMRSDISEVDQENIRKFGASLRQYLQVMILISVLRALKDDEDDKEALMILNAGLNVSDRVENDLALFGRPGAFLDMTQGDFLAAIGAASDVEKFGEAVVKTAQGDGMIETGVYAGKSRMWHHFQKLVPHLGSVQRVANNLDRELGS